MTELQRLALGTIPTVCKVPPKKEQEEAFLAQPIMIKGATFSSNDATGDKEAKQDILSDWINYYYRQRNVHMKYKSPNVYEKDDGDDGDSAGSQSQWLPLPPSIMERIQEIPNEMKEKRKELIEKIKQGYPVEKCPYEITLEEVYPLPLSDMEDSSDPVKVKVEGNTVKVKLYIKFIKDLDATLKDNWFDQEEKMVDLFMNAVKEGWNLSFSGSSYDFWPGFEGKIETTVIRQDQPNETISSNQKFVTVQLNNKDSEHYDPPRVEIAKVYDETTGYFDLYWSRDKEKKVYLYTEWRNQDIAGKKIDTYSSYSKENFKTLCVHELGHVFGMGDAYLWYDVFPYDNGIGDGYIADNPEIPTNQYTVFNAFKTQEEDAMRGYGAVTPNNVEMLLLAFTNNEKQYFSSGNPTNMGTGEQYSPSQKSKAIKYKQSYTDEEP